MHLRCAKSTSTVKTEYCHGCGVAEAPPFFQAGWSGFLYFTLSLFVSFGNLGFMYVFCSYEATVSYRSSAEMSCREEVGVSLVALGSLKPQTARHKLRSAAITHHLKNQLEGHYPEVPFSEFGPSSFMGIREVEGCRPSKARFFLGSD
jgi:hypothetical protein